MPLPVDGNATSGECRHAASGAIRAMSGLRHNWADEESVESDPAADATSLRWQTEHETVLLWGVSEALATGWKSLAVEVQRAAQDPEAGIQGARERHTDWLTAFAQYVTGTPGATLAVDDDPTDAAILAGRIGVDVWTTAVRACGGAPYAAHAVASLFGGRAGMESALIALSYFYVCQVLAGTNRGWAADVQGRADAERERQRERRRKEIAAAERKEKTAQKTAQKNREKIEALEQESEDDIPESVGGTLARANVTDLAGYHGGHRPALRRLREVTLEEVVGSAEARGSAGGVASAPVEAPKNIGEKNVEDVDEDEEVSIRRERPHADGMSNMSARDGFDDAQVYLTVPEVVETLLRCDELD